MGFDWYDLYSVVENIEHFFIFVARSNGTNFELHNPLSDLQELEPTSIYLSLQKFQPEGSYKWRVLISELLLYLEQLFWF